MTSAGFPVDRRSVRPRAIVFQESDAERYAAALADARTPSLLPAPGYLEASIVIDGLRDPVVGYQLDAVIKASRIRIEPFTEEHGRIRSPGYRISDAAAATRRG